MKGRVFTEEFKSQAVAMVLMENRKPSEVCRNLGLNTSTLRNWLREAHARGRSVVAHGQVDEEVRALRARLREAEMERDILKKAVAFFATA